ncbi:MAG: glutathione peroxidase [Acidobacteriaceae bacterium]|nr:glutathione peroxidase [Acidobacteriaceae bacterium]
MSTVTNIPVKTIGGEASSLGEYTGKVLLVVNVASKCGFTPQYEGLEKLYNEFKDKGFDVLGFPANDFGAQEPGTNAEIAEFCSLNFGVSFPLFEKIVVTGAEKHPLYAALIAAQPESIGDDGSLREKLAGFAASKGMPAPNAAPEVLWNFEKFLISKDGEVVGRYCSVIAPDDAVLTSAIEAELAK